MGYTHYWYQPIGSKIPPETWAKIKADAGKLITMFPHPVAFECDAPQMLPELSDQHIRFNGVGEEGHETFMLERCVAKTQKSYRKDEPDIFSFCKTAYKPYDTLVCAILAVAHQHADTLVKVASDGDSKDWAEAMEFAKGALGRAVTCPVP